MERELENVIIFKTPQNGEISKAISLIAELIKQLSEEKQIPIRKRRMALLIDVLININSFDKLPKEGLILETEIT